jgi:uncharacterized protein YdhG (YjbR/CyaY superfamily)
MSDQFETVDEYIESFPEGVRLILEELRSTIRSSAPEAVEVISYRIPTFKLGGKSLIYFAAWKNHIGVYPVPATNEDLDRQLAPYRSGADTLRFPLRDPMPLGLIENVVQFLVQRLSERA